MASADHSILWKPVRRSVVDQVVDALRDRLQQGDWPHWLPPERQLCEQFGVSRSTLRAALALLRQEGLLAIDRPKRTRVTLRGRQPRSHRDQALVRLLYPEPPRSMAQAQLLILDELRHQLMGKGVELAVHGERRLSLQRPERFLAEWTRQNPASLWLLTSQSAAVQRWFQKMRLPAVVFGSCHPGVGLPQVDLDSRAICRHAGGVFLRLGHRRVLFLLQQTGRAGDRLSEQGFQEAFRGTPDREVEARVIRHNGSVPSIRAVLAAQWGAPQPPTAILVCHPQYVVTVITQLARLRIRVPEDFSLISRTDDSILTYVVPAVACYVHSTTEAVAKLSRLILRAIAGHVLPRRAFFAAEFQRRGSVGPCPP